MQDELELESELFHGVTGEDVAVFTAVAAQHPPLVVARMTRATCHLRLLEEARATARRAELRYRLAGLPFAGGAMLVHAPNGADRRRLLAYIGDSLSGRGCGVLPDTGLGAGDLALLRGVPGQASEVGDLGRWTALGLFAAIERLATERLATPLYGSTVVVQGLGSVGMALCELLDAAGAVLMVADPRRERLRQATLLFNAIPLAPERAVTAVADIFVPCTSDAPFGTEAAAGLRARLIVGGACAALADDEVADRLRDRGIAWVPDFVVDAGAAIAAAAPRLRLDRSGVEQRVRDIADTAARVMAHADRHGMRPHVAAHVLARRSLGGTRAEQLAAFA